MARKYVDYTGEVLDKLVCKKKLDAKNNDGVYQYLYLCECGSERTATRSVLTRRLKSGLRVSCGCSDKPSTKDITGAKKNMLTALESTGTKSTNGDSIWKFKCDCGTVCNITIGAFNSGWTKSCGCLRGISARSRKDYHGRTGTKTYNSWAGIKARCYNEKSDSYKHYGGRGILMDESFINDFQAFYKEMGNPPEDGQYWSIDRIDNSKGYIKGNMRWATRDLQARNKRGKSNSETGIKGVFLEHKKGVLASGKIKVHTYAATSYYDLDGNKYTKRFSFKKYGEELAMFLAQEYRLAMLEHLNLLGAGYTEQHIYGA